METHPKGAFALILLLRNSTNKAPACKANCAIAHQFFLPLDIFPAYSAFQQVRKEDRGGGGGGGVKEVKEEEEENFQANCA